MPTRYSTSIAVSMFLLATGAAGAADGEPGALFTRNDTLIVTIEAPFSMLEDNRDESNEHDGTFQFNDSDGASHTLDLKIRPRGLFRRNEKVCDFPPLRLNFKKKQLKGTEFAGQNKLKLVTHCKKSDRYEQNVLQEYLAYRILNLLTDYSLRVRLLHVDYVDSGNDSKVLTRYAFLLEDEDDLARRADLHKAHVQEIDYEQLDLEQTALVSVFEYLIGNTDFSIVQRGPSENDCCHNAILYTNATGRYIPVPYDFDFSGLVDAPYAAPGPNLRIDDVTDRLYRGVCRVNDQLPAAFERIVNSRAAIEELIETLDGLSKGSRASTGRYIDGFYRDIATPGKIERNFLRKCL